MVAALTTNALKNGERHALSRSPGNADSKTLSSKSPVVVCDWLDSLMLREFVVELSIRAIITTPLPKIYCDGRSLCSAWIGEFRHLWKHRVRRVQ
jgi:hypothetical protein